MPTVKRAPRRGQEFTHLHTFDPLWQPEPGQTYAADCPKARMTITRVSREAVYYRYSCMGTRAAFYMDRATFARDYADVR